MYFYFRFNDYSLIVFSWFYFAGKHWIPRNIFIFDLSLTWLPTSLEFSVATSLAAGRKPAFLLWVSLSTATATTIIVPVIMLFPSHTVWTLLKCMFYGFSHPVGTMAAFQCTRYFMQVCHLSVFFCFQVVQALLWGGSLGLSFFLIFITTPWNRGNLPGDVTTAIYAGFHRLAWSLSLCWLHYACATGRGGRAQTFVYLYGLSLSPFKKNFRSICAALKAKLRSNEKRANPMLRQQNCVRVCLLRSAILNLAVQISIERKSFRFYKPETLNPLTTSLDEYVSSMQEHPRCKQYYIVFVFDPLSRCGKIIFGYSSKSETVVFKVKVIATLYERSTCKFYSRQLLTRCLFLQVWWTNFFRRDFSKC